VEQLFENLLYRGESEKLEFKVDQYSFTKGTDDEKSELLKDILAFANAWRDTDAYILIGVQESRSGKAAALGISAHLADHELQQFINSKTQRPIKFGYETLMFQGAQFGIIRIPVQDRPVHLLKPYGKLKANVVYIRRGSSTSEALPDEICQMGQSRSVIKPVFDLTAKPRFQRGKSSEFVDLRVQIKNTSLVTASELMIAVEKLTCKKWQCNTQFWEMKMPRPNYQLVALHSLHPGAIQDVGLFSLGRAKSALVVVSPGLAESTKRPAVKYEGIPHEIRFVVHARDIQASRFCIEFSVPEIETLQEKTFSLAKK